MLPNGMYVLSEPYLAYGKSPGINKSSLTFNAAAIFEIVFLDALPLIALLIPASVIPVCAASSF